MGRNAGYRGIFVIAHGQTELDGIRAAPLDALRVGSVWRWWGQAVRVDGPADLIVLDGAAGRADLRARAARSVRRLMGETLQPLRPPLSTMAEDRHPRHGFTLTDGRERYTATVISDGIESSLLEFAGTLPPRDVDLFVVEHAMRSSKDRAADPAGVICFTPGTLMATPDGLRAVEAIRPGDRISTRDEGAQEVLWTGSRRMSGARLHAMPHLRPVRIRAGAMGEERPAHDLVVSPGHRMLVSGPRARALFNQDEVLVAACDLIDDRLVLTDTTLREVTYIHLLTERHQIVWANGLETESFHPANADLSLIGGAERAGLEALIPGVGEDPFRYGAHARRNLNASEAAILRHAAA